MTLNYKIISTVNSILNRQDPYSLLSMHRMMIGDSPRMSAYLKAIRKQDFRLQAQIIRWDNRLF